MYDHTFSSFNITSDSSRKNFQKYLLLYMLVSFDTSPNTFIWYMRMNTVLQNFNPSSLANTRPLNSILSFSVFHWLEMRKGKTVILFFLLYHKKIFSLRGFNDQRYLILSDQQKLRITRKLWYLLLRKFLLFKSEFRKGDSALGHELTQMWVFPYIF